VKLIICSVAQRNLMTESRFDANWTEFGQLTAEWVKAAIKSTILFFQLFSDFHSEFAILLTMLDLVYVPVLKRIE